jgi:selenocysteine lyase/cysteine desulfurase
VVRRVTYRAPLKDPAELVATVRAAITPRTRVIELPHLVNWTGQITPIRELSALARERNIELLVDGAHAFAHFPFTRDALDCDYYGTSLHKWLLAPIGTGFLYVRRENIAALWPLTPAAESKKDDIRKFEEIGTHPAANHNAIAEALTFHDGIGGERKAERLRYLRNRWANRLSRHPKVRLHTNLDPAHSCAIGTVQVLGVPTGKAVQQLWEKWRIIATPIVHAEYEGIRVTPNVYTTLEEIDTFGDAMEQVSGGA